MSISRNIDILQRDTTSPIVKSKELTVANLSQIRMSLTLPLTHAISLTQLESAHAVNESADSQLHSQASHSVSYDKIVKTQTIFEEPHTDTDVELVYSNDDADVLETDAQ